jgi:D-lactate dehydrogenase (cytochrome)
MTAHMVPPAPRPSKETVAQVIAELTRTFGNRCVTSQAVREQHANTLAWVANQPPDAVVYPMNTEDVVSVVKLCAAHKVPVIPFGAGSST